MSKIQQTLDLSKFHIKPLEKNRKINRNHVKNLAARIKAKGLKRPIEVDSRGLILDGQHRYLAVQMLQEDGHKIRLKYITTTMTADDIAEINGYQLRWSSTDWIDHYARKGNENYTKLLEAKEKYAPLPIHTIAPLQTPNLYFHTGSITDGTYEYHTCERREYILEQLQLLQKHNHVYKTKQVAVAITWLMRQDSFDEQRLFKKLRANLHTVLVQSGCHNWAMHLLYWYNKGLRSGRLDPTKVPKHH